MTQMTKQYSEGLLKNGTPIAIMTSVLPAAILDFVYQNVDSKTKLEHIVDKAKAWGESRGCGLRADHDEHWRNELWQRRLE